ncbi:hypothetical protein TA3x_004461 [Tundrisphaera sp. TA3]|uniref:hypothetical protein n=1 Tax=Tundrisphaera sp. TA3 TaxID=3435775 RepID=UPI003EBD3F4D
MTPSDHDRPYREFVDGAGVLAFRFRMWAGDEWRAIPAGQRPPGAVRVGTDWAEFLCCDRTDGGVPIDPRRVPPGRGAFVIGSMIRPLKRLGRGIPADAILVDPAMPGIQEYLRQATLDGQIRTVPAGRDRVYIIPLAHRTGLESRAAS